VLGELEVTNGEFVDMNDGQDVSEFENQFLEILGYLDESCALRLA
jgi:hypothetical protein